VTMRRQKLTQIDDDAAVGGRLRAIRKRAQLSLSQLAFPGCSAGYLSLIERGRRTPSLQVLHELGRRLGVNAEYLAWGRRPSGGA
jgi:transcriptional regulator with XRE-family HTH domain